MDFLQKIDKRIAELQAVREIYIREMLGDSSDTGGASTPPILGDTGVINVDDLGLPNKPDSKRNTLEKIAISVIKRFDKREFTVNHAFAALNQMGKVTTNGKNYKNRLSMVIRKLTTDGVLERTHKGVGNDPHKYREVTTNED